MNGNEYWLAQYLAEFTYLGMFMILFVGGFGLPFPEEIVLVLAGYGIYAELTKPMLTFTACLMGAMAGDLVMYWIGRWWTAVPMKWRWTRRVISRRRMVKIQRKFRKYGVKFLFFCRLVTGLRMAAFFLCGAMKMNVFKFVAIDVSATVFAVTFYTFIGYHFGSKISATIKYVRRANEHMMVLSILAIALFLAGYFVYRLYNPKPRAPKKLKQKVEQEEEVSR